MRYNDFENVPASRKVAFAACFRLRKIGAQVIPTSPSDRAIALATQLPKLPPQLCCLRQAAFLSLEHIGNDIGELHMARFVRGARHNVRTIRPHASCFALNCRSESGTAAWGNITGVVPEFVQFPVVKDLFRHKQTCRWREQVRLIKNLIAKLLCQHSFFKYHCDNLSIGSCIVHYAKQHVGTASEPVPMKLFPLRKTKFQPPLCEHVVQFLFDSNTA